MTEEPQVPDEWSKAERWVWERIEAGEIADFNERGRESDSAFKDLDPTEAQGWDDSRRLSISFLQTILTKKPFVDATPFKGVRILGALVDGEFPLDLAHGRLERLFWLEKSRLLVDVKFHNLRIDGEISLWGNYIKGTVALCAARISGNVSVNGSFCEGDVNLVDAKIGGTLTMYGCTFDGRLNMIGTEVGQNLAMSGKSTFKDVSLGTAKIGGQIDMSGSKFDGLLNMNGTEVGQNLAMRGKATFKDVVLVTAKIGGQLDMSDSNFDGQLDMGAIEVGRDLLMREKATFKDVNLRGAKIGGQLDMSGSKFDGTLDMDSIEVGQNLLMDEITTFKDIILGGAKIGGQLDMSGSKFDGTLDMDEVEVGQSLLARSTKFPLDKKVALYFATIGFNLDLSGATIGAIDLTGTTVDGELRLGSGMGHEPPTWVLPSRMVLRNTTIGAIQDAHEGPECWPNRLELDGFTYRHLGGFGAVGAADMGKRSSAWFAKWLMRGEAYSPQPYQQLANVLRQMGYPRKADDVLYAGRKRAHCQALEEGEWRRWAGMSLLRWTIGFGIGWRYFLSVLWVLFFTFVGVFVFVKFLPAERLDLPDWLAGEQPSHSGKVLSSVEGAAPTERTRDLYDLWWASFDQLLPIVTLDKTHENLTTAPALPWCARYYFYIQRLVGWVLGSFLIAGLAGLTQKS